MKKFPKWILLAVLFSGAGAAEVLAQQNPSDNVWSLAEAVEYAQSNNLQIKQSRISRDLNEIDLRQARFDRLPTLNASSNLTYSSGTTVDPTVQELRTNEYTSIGMQAGTSLPIFMGFQQTNLIKQYGIELQASEQDILATQNDVILQIVTSYLNILFAQELIKTSELQRTTTQQQLDRTRILFKAGSLAENAVLDLESQLASDELNIINAQNQREIARLSLAQLLNLEGEALKGFEVAIPEVPEPSASPVLENPVIIFDDASMTQPSIKAADLRVLSAARALEVARGAYYPRLSLSAGINTFYNSQGRLFDPSGTFDPRSIGFRDPNGTEPLIIYSPGLVEKDYPFTEQIRNTIGKQIGLSLSIPIFNGLQARSGVQRAKLAQLNAELNAEIERNQLRQTIEQAYVDALSAQRQYMAAKTQVQALERSFKNAELRLENGIINTVDFYVIANNYRNALSSLLQAKYEYTFKLKVLDFYQGKDISF